MCPAVADIAQLARTIRRLTVEDSRERIAEGAEVLGHRSQQDRQVARVVAIDMASTLAVLLGDDLGPLGDLRCQLGEAGTHDRLKPVHQHAESALQYFPRLEL